MSVDTSSAELSADGPVTESTPRRPRHILTDAERGKGQKQLAQSVRFLSAWIRKPEDEQYATTQNFWSFLEYSLLRRALQLVAKFTPQSVRMLHPVIVQAAIAHDKRWSKKDTGSVTLSIPQSIQHSIELALRIGKPVADQATNPAESNE